MAININIEEVAGIIDLYATGATVNVPSDIGNAPPPVDEGCLTWKARDMAGFSHTITLWNGFYHGRKVSTSYLRYQVYDLTQKLVDQWYSCKPCRY